MMYVSEDWGHSNDLQACSAALLCVDTLDDIEKVLSSLCLSVCQRRAAAARLMSCGKMCLLFISVTYVICSTLLTFFISWMRKVEKSEKFI